MRHPCGEERRLRWIDAGRRRHLGVGAVATAFEFGRHQRDRDGGKAATRAKSERAHHGPAIRIVPSASTMPLIDRAAIDVAQAQHIADAARLQRHGQA